jgi:IS30 family transposase
MDQSNFNTIERSRKQGHHLTHERGMIQALHEQGYSLRGIAAAVGCAHTTVHYELRRGTPERKGGRGRMPKYTAKRGQQAYKEHRRNARRPCKLDSDNCEPFIQWMVEHVRKKRWSLDTCVGHARLQNLFQPEQIPCTRTLYNMLWAGKLPLSLFDVPQALGRKQHRKWNRKNKRMKGRSIEDRPAIQSSSSTDFPQASPG